MKVTKPEVIDAVEALTDVVVDDVDIHIGVEAGGKMCVVYCKQGVSRDFAQAFSMAVVGLAEAHGEGYTPYIMRDAWFERYKAFNGFVEVEEEKSFPVSISWQKDNVSLWGDGGDDSIHLGYASDEALETFCCDALKKIQDRRGE